MVAKTPTKERRALMALNSNQVRETLKKVCFSFYVDFFEFFSTFEVNLFFVFEFWKVDKCMARLQELQYTVTGGSKVVSGKSLSPRSTRGYYRTSLRCKQETVRMKGSTPAKKSPIGKFQGSTNSDWRQTSLPAMLLGETVVEILQASQFAKNLVSKSQLSQDPRTPIRVRKIRETNSQFQTPLRLRRTREKQNLKNKIQESRSPKNRVLTRSRIQFKSISPNPNPNRASVSANRVSPKNRPFAKKTVLFPNPSFVPSSPIPANRTGTKIVPKTSKMVQTPHKFVIKSPPKCLGTQLRYQKAVPVLKSPLRKVEMVPVEKPRRCSFSPVKMVARFVSPLKGRISPRRSFGGLGFSGLKQRPSFNSNSNLKFGKNM
ncbi:hypothetical protein LUZ60_007831 [Juncus effusus]|nr:hypothetical protein LUZ60_007831 [Juncus effusus]